MATIVALGRRTAAGELGRQSARTLSLPMGLDVVEMVMAIEREYNIELPDADLAQVSTIGELEALVANATGAVDAEAGARLHARLLDIIVEETGVDRKRLMPGARIHEDLGLG